MDKWNRFREVREKVIDQYLIQKRKQKLGYLILYKTVLAQIIARLHFNFIKQVKMFDSLTFKFKYKHLNIWKIISRFNRIFKLQEVTLMLFGERKVRIDFNWN